MIFGILFGYLSATSAGGVLDRVLTVLALMGISMPVFWLATIFSSTSRTKVKSSPPGAMWGSRKTLDWAYHLAVPWLTVANVYVGFYSQVLRSNMLDVMHEDDGRTARPRASARGA